jgi:LL-diaminopimelate aminotransferase
MKYCTIRNVFITPGGIFGSAGDGYIRVSLCGSVERFKRRLGGLGEGWELKVNSE